MWERLHPSRHHFLWRSGTLLEIRKFWTDVDQSDVGVLFVAFWESWKNVGDHQGVQAVDIGEHVFASLCRFATRYADYQARLSPTVFAAYWVSGGEEKAAIEALERWLPMRISSDQASMTLEVAFMSVQRQSGERAEDLFRRMEKALAGRVDALPASDKHSGLYYTWSRVVGTEP